MARYRKGTKVTWKWGASTAEGKVEQSFVEDVERTIKGEKIKRKASKEEPAYLVVQEEGGRALKSHSELTPAKKSADKKSSSKSGSR